MNIFELISNDNFYFASCMKIAKNKEDAYDLMMDTALTINEQGGAKTNPRSMFYTIALRTWVREKKDLYNIEDFKIEDKDFGKYNKDIIDCALALLENQPKDKREFVTLNIFKLYLKHGSAQKVEDVTNIKRRTINHHVLKFKDYAIRHCSMYT